MQSFLEQGYFQKSHSWSSSELGEGYQTTLPPQTPNYKFLLQELEVSGFWTDPSTRSLEFAYVGFMPPERILLRVKALFTFSGVGTVDSRVEVEAVSLKRFEESSRAFGNLEVALILFGVVRLLLITFYRKITFEGADALEFFGIVFAVAAAIFNGMARDLVNPQSYTDSCSNEDSASSASSASCIRSSSSCQGPDCFWPSSAANAGVDGLSPDGREFANFDTIFHHLYWSRSLTGLGAGLVWLCLSRRIISLVYDLELISITVVLSTSFFFAILTSICMCRDLFQATSIIVSSEVTGLDSGVADFVQLVLHLFFSGLLVAILQVNTKLMSIPTFREMLDTIFSIHVAADSRPNTPARSVTPQQMEEDEFAEFYPQDHDRTRLLHILRPVLSSRNWWLGSTLVQKKLDHVVGKYLRKDATRLALIEELQHKAVHTLQNARLLAGGLQPYHKTAGNTKWLPEMRAFGRRGFERNKLMDRIMPSGIIHFKPSNAEHPHENPLKRPSQPKKINPLRVLSTVAKSRGIRTTAALSESAQA